MWLRLTYARQTVTREARRAGAEMTTNKHLARLTAHPTDTRTVLLHTPPGLATDMGRFEPARYDQAHRAYLVHVDHLAALHRFAATIALHIVDERTRPPGQRPLMPECIHCGQPAKLTRQPHRCPGCGQPWKPTFVDPGTGHGEAVRQTCDHCGHTQRGRFGYCGACGEPMPADDPDRPHRPPRRHLNDPLPLADTITETAGLLPARPSADAGDPDGFTPPF